MSQDDAAHPPTPSAAAPRPATMAELRAMVAKAKHPTEREKLTGQPEEALRQAGLRPTKAAADFLRSMGEMPFDEEAEKDQAARSDPMKGGTGET